MKFDVRNFQDSLLGKLFINKIMQAKPSSVSWGMWVEMIFGLHERYIIQYEVNRSFKIEAIYKPLPDVRLTGIGHQVIKQGKRVWLRFDETIPNAIDLEAPIGIGEEPRMFQLNFEQWSKIRMWLCPVHKKDKLLHERTTDPNFGARCHTGK